MDFLTFARASGLVIKRLIADGKIHRCPTADKPRSDNGAYMLDGDRGWIMDWAKGGEAIWWNDESAQPWTDAQKREWAEKQRAAEKAKQIGYAEAAKRAAQLIERAERATHPYLKEKGFPDALSLTLNEALLVPMRDVQSNGLRGLQSIRLIDNKWEKKMLPGMRAKGSVLRIGPPRTSEAVLVEGFATGLSVEAAAHFLKLHTAIVVCFSSGNLVHVAPQVPGRKFVFADNDESETGEKAAKESGLPYCMADEVGMDANDLHRIAGIVAVAQKLMEARRR